MDFSYLQLYKAWEKFKKGKKKTQSIDEFAYSLEDNLQKLGKDINNRCYKHGDYKKVVILEKKRRDLAVAEVRDRVVHRLVYDELVNIWDKSFDPDVWSSRTSKGLHGALARTQKLLQKHQYSYVWRADITKFFDHVRHDVLLDCINHKTQSNSKLFWLCNEIINSYSTLASQPAKAYPLVI